MEIRGDYNLHFSGLPPCGGSGLKCLGRRTWGVAEISSPSVWREWIEMAQNQSDAQKYESLPPCGGSGLKCQRHEHSHIKNCGLPPCGGSGLKWLSTINPWANSSVSLRVEGVD